MAMMAVKIVESVYSDCRFIGTDKNLRVMRLARYTAAIHQGKTQVTSHRSFVSDCRSSASDQPM